jgi:hypothetical protein
MSPWGNQDDVEMIYDYNGERMVPGGTNNNSNSNNNVSSVQTTAHRNNGGRNRSRNQQQDQQEQQQLSRGTPPEGPYVDNNNKNNNNMNGSSGSKTTGRFSQVDLDNVFDPFTAQEDDVAEFFEDDDHHYADLDAEIENPNRVYSDPTRTGVLNDAVHQIAGSPWAKPGYYPSNRPTDPLPIAKYASSIALILTLGLVIFLLSMSIYNYTSIARIIVEVILSILSFFGLFWNSYFTVSMIFK